MSQYRAYFVPGGVDPLGLLIRQIDDEIFGHSGLNPSSWYRNGSPQSFPSKDDPDPPEGWETWPLHGRGHQIGNTRCRVFIDTCCSYLASIAVRGFRGREPGYKEVQEKSDGLHFYTFVKIIVVLREPEGDCSLGDKVKLSFDGFKVFPGRYLSGLSANVKIPPCKDSTPTLSELIDSISSSARKQILDQPWGEN